MASLCPFAGLLASLPALHTGRPLLRLLLPRSCSLMRDGAASLPALCAAPYLKRYGRPFVPAGLGCGSAASACSLLLLSLLPSCCFGAPSCLSPLRPPLLLSKEIGAACLLLLCLSPPAPLLLCTAGLSPLPPSSALLRSCRAFAAPLPCHTRSRTGRPLGRPPLPSLCFFAALLGLLLGLRCCRLLCLLSRLLACLSVCLCLRLSLGLLQLSAGLCVACLHLSALGLCCA